MHYFPYTNIIVKSENVALSTIQTNKVILDYITKLPENLIALDYGCGKLRHSIPLYSKAEELTVIDSSIQLNRHQTINGQRTSVNEYVYEHLKKAKAFSIDEFHWPSEKFDFILCTNVLSAIPDYTERQTVLTNINSLLKKTGKALISTQYSNSYFKTYERPSTIKYLDGWLISRRDGSYSFYGIISMDQLVTLCDASGLTVYSKNTIDGSAYLEVMKK